MVTERLLEPVKNMHNYGFAYLQTEAGKVADSIMPDGT
jgi:hypothetical protein